LEDVENSQGFDPRKPASKMKNPLAETKGFFIFEVPYL